MTTLPLPAAVTFLGLSLGPGHPCVPIAEIGLNHNGDLGLALNLIEAAVKAGALIVKFQKRDVDGLAINSVLDAADGRFPTFGSTYRQIREHLEFGWDNYVQLQQASKALGVRFLATPFDIPSVEFLERLGVSAYKIASHSVTNVPLLECVSGTQKPVMMSTGMCTWQELDEAVDVFMRSKTPLILMHCVSAYPQPVEASNLSLIPVLRSRYGVPVGYSGHELGYGPTLTAVALGAVAVERHFTLDHDMVGFDHKLSLTPAEFTIMVKAIQDTTRALGNGDKSVSTQETATRKKYHVSIVSQREIAPGQRISGDMLVFKNPGTGLAPQQLHSVVNRKAKIRISIDTVIQLDMLE
jgi:sialic acid synthase SpsE